MELGQISGSFGDGSAGNAYILCVQRGIPVADQQTHWRKNDTYTDKTWDFLTDISTDSYSKTVRNPS